MRIKTMPNFWPLGKPVVDLPCDHVPIERLIRGPDLRALVNTLVIGERLVLPNIRLMERASVVASMCGKNGRHYEAYRDAEYPGNAYVLRIK